MVINKNCVVNLHYSLFDEEGRELVNSREDEALTYLHGSGQLIPGLEAALEGAKEGQSVSCTLSPEEAYGPHLAEMVFDIPRDQINNAEQITVGAVVTGVDPEGNERHHIVAAVTDETITLDANHPLAGKTLRYDVEVLSVREAADESGQ